MKFLAFFLVAAFVGAQADFVQLNLDNEISAMVNEIHSAREARETNILERATTTALGQTLEEKLKNVTDKINNLLSTGHSVGKALLEQAKTLTAQLKEMGGKYVTDAKAILGSLKDQFSGFFQGILDSFGGLFGKRDLFENFEEELLDELQ
ncbi:uncharacterized protein LOC106166861 [Lingula anatina]|uniref:Uncharacterized protein LOC106166861 n=1 Tax=Lingula anatina TaxID=7574 RepID=A0A1S3ISR7_LINAN|nr:uncharacterized protein LOC106166861 [Lingula anatina]|eukprot:XP_013400981.1 uncharacterized protein LOC106166861 [Lingula anatina]